MSNDDLVTRLQGERGHLVNRLDREEAAARITELEAALDKHGAGAVCDDFDCICKVCQKDGCPCGDRNIAAFAGASARTGRAALSGEPT